MHHGGFSMVRIQGEVVTQVRARVVMTNEDLGSAVVAVLESATADSVMSRLGPDRVRPAVTDKTKRVEKTQIRRPSPGRTGGSKTSR